MSCCGETWTGVDGCQPKLRQASVTVPVDDDVRLSSQHQHYHTQLRGKEGSQLQGRKYEMRPRGIRKTTYPLQIPMRDIERMKVFQSPRDIEQLPRISKMKLVIYCSSLGKGSLSYQRWSRCVRVRRHVLIDVPVLPPVVNKGKLEECRVYATKR